MKRVMYTFTGLAGALVAASAASAQPAEVPANDHAAPHAEGALPGDEAAAPAGPAAPATPATPATRATPADPATDSAAVPAVPATPADPATPAAETTAAADVTDADIDSFARATVKLREIQADTTIAADQKQSAMAAAVAETGLDAAKYNAIGQAAQADAELRAKVQTAMSRYAAPAPAEG